MKIKKFWRRSSLVNKKRKCNANATPRENVTDNLEYRDGKVLGIFKMCFCDQQNMDIAEVD